MRVSNKGMSSAFGLGFGELRRGIAVPQFAFKERVWVPGKKKNWANNNDSYRPPDIAWKLKKQQWNTNEKQR